MSVTDLIPGVAQGKLIIAGLALGAFAVPTVGWYIDHHKLATRTAERDLARTQLAAESNAHNVTLQSLSQCSRHLADKSAESDARAKALADSTASYRAELAALKKQNAGQATKLEYWQGMADKYQAEGKCPISDDLARELNR